MHLFLTIALILSVLCVLAAAVGRRLRDYDVVLRNGRVLDGNGNPWIAGDVAIRNGRFVRIGHVPSRGRLDIDVQGHYVSPGWIDSMDHSGEVLSAIGTAENKLQQGVTTAIGGEGGAPVNVEDLKYFLQKLELSGISINFGTHFSETQVRVAVLSAAPRDPTGEELSRMRSLVETAMLGGALGMTSALIYQPASYARTPELIEMAKVVAKYGGVYATHVRDEGAGVVQAIDEALEIGEKAGLPVEIFHLKVAYRPGWGTLLREVGAHVDAARKRGLDIGANVYLYTAAGTGLEAAQSLNIEASVGWSGVVIANARNPENQAYVGKSLTEVAREMGKHDPAEAASALIAAGNGRVMALFHMMCEEDIETALRFPWTSIGSDAGAAKEANGADALGFSHPRAYGNFPRLIAKYVRERRVITLEDAIRKMTSLPASRLHLVRRGSIKEGMWADVVVFDYDRIQDRATYENPTLAPEGIDYVFVNGKLVIDRGRHTGARPGQILYGPGWRWTTAIVARVRALLSLIRHH